MWSSIQRRPCFKSGSPRWVCQSIRSVLGERRLVYFHTVALYGTQSCFVLSCFTSPALVRSTIHLHALAPHLESRSDSLRTAPGWHPGRRCISRYPLLSSSTRLPPRIAPRSPESYYNSKWLPQRAGCTLHCLTSGKQHPQPRRCLCPSAVK